MVTIVTRGIANRSKYFSINIWPYFIYFYLVCINTHNYYFDIPIYPLHSLHLLLVNTIIYLSMGIFIPISEENFEEVCRLSAMGLEKQLFGGYRKECSAVDINLYFRVQKLIKFK